MDADNEARAVPHRALIALGSNIEPGRHLPAAVHRLRELGVVLRCSRVWQSAPVGFAEQADFCNAAVLLLTPLRPRQLRMQLRRIEHELGRRRDPDNKNGPRTIDLDIAAFDDLRARRGEPPLPDPEIQRREFLLAPLAEVDGEYCLPGDGRTLAELTSASRFGDTLQLRTDIMLPSSVLDDTSPVDRMREALGSHRSDTIGLHDQTPGKFSSHRLMSLDTIQLRFCYGHRLLNYAGKCRHLHGHTARVEFTLGESADPDQWDAHRSELDSWIRGHLNARMILCQQDPALAALARLGEPVHLVETNPTTENLARLLFHAGLELGVPLIQVRMWESPRCSALYLAHPQPRVESAAQQDPHA
ncbi:MAG: 2-amino-4-hydroxy-6-hydroxymethyldihydropteridine diphosphokinase [Planctomycetales bacterium]|nr:2-amino-4-hydroxy-6-hydroxymethyldihydropteridine diphosphokinase [Planctomycetales bacterium]